MTKFNKLLSIFVIAGAVATGTAALVGCDGHIHSATKHEAVAATCTHAGTKEYYTCSGSECEGKYFSDEACTTEVTLESLTIAATGHTAVEHAATAATCTQTGNSLYYTCSGSECEGKYYTDAACTTETTLAAVTIAATGHTATPHEAHAATCTQAGNSAYYTCSGSECDGKYYSDEACTTETTLANTVIPALGHKDDNNDFRCDNNCGTNVFKAGHYYGVGYANMEIEVEENGTVWYKDAEYHIALSAEGVATLTLNVSSSGSSTTEEVTYTLTETAEGYKANHSSNVDIYLIEVPESKGVEIASFNGVFEGEYTYTVRGDGTYKITKLAITADGKVQRTQVKIKDKNGDAITNSQPITDLLTDGAVTDKYNEFKAENFYFIATEVEDGTYGGQSIKYVTKLKVTYDGAVLAEFNKTTESVKAVPTSLPLDDYTYYEDEDEIGMRLLATASGTTKSYKISNVSLTIVNVDDTTREYLVYMYNSSVGTGGNITLKISADRNTIEVTPVSNQAGNQTITLTKRTQTFPALKVDGTENKSAVVDIFNEEYAYYKVVDAGWYTFTARSTDVKLYTEVDNHLVTSSGSTVLNISSGARRTVQLEAGAYIAVDSNAATTAFTATYSATEPVAEAATFTNGKYEIANFDGSQTYTIKGKTASATKYYITVYSSVRTTQGLKECLVLNVNGVDYGTYFDGSSLKTVTMTAGEIYTKELAADTDVTVVVSTPNTGWNFGKVIVYFETEEEYNNRINSGSTGGEDTTFEGFTADQQGRYTHSYTSFGFPESFTLIIGADTVTKEYSDGYQEELTFVSLKYGVYTYACYGFNMSFSFTDDGKISVSSDKIHDLDPYVISKDESSSGGEEEANVAVVGENTVQVGKGGSVDIEFSVAGTYKITYGSSDNVWYIEIDGTTYTGAPFTVTDPVTITVYASDNSAESKFTIAVAQATGGETTTNKVENGGNLALGDNEVTTYDGYAATVYLTASSTLPAGTYTLTFTNLWGASLKVDDTSVMDDSKGNATTEVVLGDTPIAIGFVMGDNNVTINVAAKA